MKFGERIKRLKNLYYGIATDIKRNYIISCAGPWAKLIRTELLKKNQLYFLEEGIYEDIAMIPLVALYASDITYIEEPLYHYYIRKGSSMRQTRFNKKLLSIYLVLETLTKGFELSRTTRKLQTGIRIYLYKALTICWNRKIFRI